MTIAPPGARAVLYIRVSSEDQLKGHSVDSQKDIGTTFIAAQKWQLVRTFTEPEGVSATNDQRQEFQKMIAELRTGIADVIVVWKIDRFSRNTIHNLTYLKEFTDRKIVYCSIVEQLDFTTPEGELMFTTFAGYAHYYSRELSRKTKIGKHTRAKKGLYNGDLSYGYRLNADTKIPEPDPRTASGIRLAFHEYLTGLHSDIGIARLLKEKGFTINGKPFSKDTIRSMLQNKFYTGVVTYKDEIYQGRHSPLITESDFKKAQEIRRSRRLLPRNPKHTDRVYPLSRLCTCADCLRNLRGITLGRHHDTRYYFDPDRLQYSGTCPNKSYINAEDLEQRVSTIFLGVQLPQNWQDRVLYHLSETHTTQSEERRRENLREKTKRLADLFSEGVYTRLEYDTRLNAAKAEFESIKPNAQQVDLTQAADLLLNFHKLYRDASPDKQKRLFSTMLERVVVRGNHILGIQPRPDFYPLLCATASLDEMVNLKRTRRASTILELNNISVQIIPPATPITRIPYLLVQ